METRMGFMKRWKNNLEVSIKFDKIRADNKRISKNMRLADLSALFSVKINEILLETINKDEDRFWWVYKNGMTNAHFRDWSRIRSCACAVVTGGRTMLVSELTDDEVQKVRELIIRFIDDYIEDFRSKIAR